mgnify:CR=1 FL=1
MGKLEMARNMVWVYLSIKMEEFIRENGRMMLRKVMELRSFLMEIFLKESMLMASQMELVLIFGEMDRGMMGNGLMGSNMDLECGEERKEASSLKPLPTTL